VEHGVEVVAVITDGTGGGSGVRSDALLAYLSSEREGLLALGYSRNGNYRTIYPSPISGQQDNLRQVVEFWDVFEFWSEVIDTVAGAIRGE
jgi:hypothetical protein